MILLYIGLNSMFALEWRIRLMRRILTSFIMLIISKDILLYILQSDTALNATCLSYYILTI